MSSVLSDKVFLVPNEDADWIGALGGVLRYGLEDLCFLTLIVTGISWVPIVLWWIIALGEGLLVGLPDFLYM